MKFPVVFVIMVLAGIAAQAQTGPELSQLRELLQSSRAMPAQQAASAAESSQRELSPEERAELRRQLSEFSAHRNTAQDGHAAELHVENHEHSSQ